MSQQHLQKFVFKKLALLLLLLLLLELMKFPLDTTALTSVTS